MQCIEWNVELRFNKKNSANYGIGLDFVFWFIDPLLKVQSNEIGALFWKLRYRGDIASVQHLIELQRYQ